MNSNSIIAPDRILIRLFFAIPFSAGSPRQEMGAHQDRWRATL
jgi:hypothetical protein